MSLILDALRKAERERNLGQGPILADVARPASRKADAGTRPQARTIALAALVLALLTLTILFWPSREEPVIGGDEPATTEAVAQTEPEPEPLDAPPPPPVVAQATPAAPEFRMPGGPQSFDDVLDPDAVQPPPSGSEYVAAADAASDQGAKSSAAENDPVRGQPVATKDEEVPPEEEVPEEPAAEPEIKHLRDQPVAYRSAFPPMKVEVHVHDPDPAKRWFMMGGKRYIEGSRLPEGPRVVEITEDGMIFNYRGETSLYTLNNN
ncbi:MAG: general secretion pathway protein GspB [Panacagrimonas sp.]